MEVGQGPNSGCSAKGEKTHTRIIAFVKLIAVQMLEESLVFYGIRKFITVFS
jgi:hypothetical protein